MSQQTLQNYQVIAQIPSGLVLLEKQSKKVAIYKLLTSPLQYDLKYKLLKQRKSARSPYLLKLLDFFIQETHETYTKTSLIYEGWNMDLEEQMQQRSLTQNFFNLKEIIYIMYTISTGLAELHQLDLIHGDIKSNNIAYFENNTLKLVDQFGFGDIFFKTKSNVLMEQNSFISPEIFCKFGNEKQEFYATKANDIFSLGMVFLEICSLLDLKGVYNWKTYEIDQGYLQELLEMVEQRYNSQLSSLLQKMLSTDAQYRIESEFLVEYLQQMNETFQNNIEEKQFGQTTLMDQTEFIINTINNCDLSVDYFQKKKQFSLHDQSNQIQNELSFMGQFNKNENSFAHSKNRYVTILEDSNEENNFSSHFYNKSSSNKVNTQNSFNSENQLNKQNQNKNLFEYQPQNYSEQNSKFLQEKNHLENQPNFQKKLSKVESKIQFGQQSTNNQVLNTYQQQQQQQQNHNLNDDYSLLSSKVQFRTDCPSSVYLNNSQTNQKYSFNNNHNNLLVNNNGKNNQLILDQIISQRSEFQDKMYRPVTDNSMSQLMVNTKIDPAILKLSNLLDKCLSETRQIIDQNRLQKSRIVQQNQQIQTHVPQNDLQNSQENNYNLNKQNLNHQFQIDFGPINSKNIPKESNYFYNNNFTGNLSEITNLQEQIRVQSENSNDYSTLNLIGGKNVTLKCPEFNKENRNSNQSKNSQINKYFAQNISLISTLDQNQINFTSQQESPQNSSNPNINIQNQQNTQSTNQNSNILDLQSFQYQDANAKQNKENKVQANQIKKKNDIDQNENINHNLNDNQLNSERICTWGCSIFN